MRTILFRLIQLAAFSVFAGRAYQHLFHDPPYRTLFWNEKMMRGFVEQFLGMDWTVYVRSESVYATFETITVGLGYWYALLAILVLFIEKIPLVGRKLLWLGSLTLVLLAGLYMLSKFNHVGQFFEYTLQFCSPIFLFYFLKKQPFELQKERSYLLFLKIAIALTFTCHGLYALNYYPRPGNFVQMTISILNCSEDTAHQFLYIAGILDFIVAIGIFLPKKWAIPFLTWTVIWGFGTTVARMWANVYIDFLADSLHQWTWESVVRCSHWVVPLVALFWQWKISQKGKSSPSKSGGTE